MKDRHKRNRITAGALAILLLLNTSVEPVLAQNAESGTETVQAVTFDDESAEKENLKTQAVTVVEKNVALFEQGEIPDADDEKKTEINGTDYSGAAEAIRTDLTQMNPQTDLRAYDLTADEVADIYQSVVNDNSGLFYVTEKLSVSCQEDGTAVSAAYTYTANQAQIAEQKAAYDQALNQIVAQVDPGWTDVQKALYVNDYLVTTAAYDHTLTYHDAYSLLVNKTGVCEAYALAYQAVMEALGIPVLIAASGAMDHAWNEIYVNGHWYHVDTTWNDPTTDLYGRAKHDYFLLSDEAIGKGVNKHYDWNTGVACDDTTFDHYEWDNIENPITCCKGGWYTIGNNKVLGLNWENGTFTEVASYADTGKSLRTGLFSYDGSLYMTDGDDILKFDVDNKTFSTFLSVGDTYGIAIDAGTIITSNIQGENYTDANLTKYLPLYSLNPVTDADGYSYIPGIWKQAVLVSYSGDQTALSIPQTVTLTPENGTASDYTVVQIGAGAFRNHPDLSTVDLPESVVGIGEEAFYGEENLTAVTGAAAHLAIGARAFYGCRNLNTFGNGDVVIDGIGGSAFYQCMSLEGLNASALRIIPNYGFYGCSSLTDLQTTSADAFGNYALAGCSSLLGVTLKEGMTFLSDGCFSGCASLRELHIPDSVTEIYDHVFQNCSSLTSIQIPDTVTWIGSGVFQGCENLQYAGLPEQMTEIPSFLFANCTSLQSLSIPAGTTQIGEYAFAGCSTLSDIELPAALTEIGACAFSRTGLYKIVVPEGVTVLDNAVFSSCTSLKDVTLPKALTTIKNTFSGCTALEEVVIPDTVTTIQAQAFYQCSSLKHITLPKELTEIGDHVFYGCSALSEIDLPEKLTTIGKSAFAGCSSLNSLRIPAAVTAIGADALKDTASLQEIRLADGNTSFAVFHGVLFNAEQTEIIACPAGIRHLYLPEEFSSIEADFAQKYSFLESLTVLNSKCVIADSSRTLNGLILIGDAGSTLDAYAKKYGNTFNVKVLSEEGEYQQTLSANGSISWKFEPEEAGTYLFEFYCENGADISLSYGDGGGGGSGVLYLEKTLEENAEKTIQITPGEWADHKARMVTMRIYKEIKYPEKCSFSGTYTITMNPYTVYLFDLPAHGNTDYDMKISGGKGLYYQIYPPNPDISIGSVIPQDQAVGNGSRQFLAHNEDQAMLRINPYLGADWKVSQQEKKQTVTVSIGKHEHTEKVVQEAVQPTCTESGSTRVTECSYCGVTLSKWMSIPATGHLWDTGKVTKKATVSAAGIKTYTCKRCGETRLESVPKLEVAYTISYQGNGATGGSMKCQTVSYGNGTKLTANTYSKKGYTFKGWNTKTDGSGKAYANKAEGSKLTTTDGSVVTLYAQWQKNTYKITYKLNGGTKAKGTVATYTVTTATITLKKPTRKGYTFKGWYTDVKCKKRITQIKKGSVGNKTLYAKWTANPYKVAFSANGTKVTGKTKMLSAVYGKSYKISANGFKRKGYTFKGWNTKKNGKGKTYKNKAVIKNLTTKAGRKITLYAQWKKK